jgi:hypothetical protein
MRLPIYVSHTGNCSTGPCGLTLNRSPPRNLIVNVPSFVATIQWRPICVRGRSCAACSSVDRVGIPSRKEDTLVVPVTLWIPPVWPVNLSDPDQPTDLCMEAGYTDPSDFLDGEGYESVEEVLKEYFVPDGCKLVDYKVAVNVKQRSYADFESSVHLVFTMENHAMFSITKGGVALAKKLNPEGDFSCYIDC